MNGSFSQAKSTDFDPLIRGKKISKAVLPTNMAINWNFYRSRTKLKSLSRIPVHFHWPVANHLSKKSCDATLKSWSDNKFHKDPYGINLPRSPEEMKMPLSGYSEQEFDHVSKNLVRDQHSANTLGIALVIKCYFLDRLPVILYTIISGAIKWVYL